MDSMSMSTPASLGLGSASSSVALGNGDFLTEYRAISSKLKKRFLRRPNVAEANEQFTKLAKRLRGDDEPHYESLCHLAVARCEQSVGNSNAEAEALIAASRGFMEAEMKVQDVGCPSFEEHLLAAIHSYAHAIRILEETNQTPRAAGLCLELGDSLHKLGKTGQALTFYQRAADLRSSTILEYIHAQEKVAICFIETGDYHNGLSTLTEVANVAEQYGGRPVASVYADMMGRTEILRVLLLLLIEPTSQNISPTLTTVLEKYAWESEDNPAAQDTVKYLSEEIFLLLQSVVMAVQIRDYAVLLELEDQLGPLMTALPRKLLRRLVNNMKEKGSGTS